MTHTNEYRQGEHICVVYETADEQRAVAAAYLADGLRRGERAYYVADTPPSLQRFSEVLWAAGIDVADAVQRTALVLATHDQAHLLDGHFDCERMLRLLNEGIESALNAGFAGLRTCGDMSWLLDEPPGAEQVVVYEALLNQLFLGSRACGMCQYDASRLPAALLDHGLATHSSVHVNERHVTNPFYRSPAIAGQRAPQPDDVHWKLRELRRR